MISIFKHGEGGFLVYISGAESICWRGQASSTLEVQQVWSSSPSSSSHTYLSSTPATPIYSSSSVSQSWWWWSWWRCLGNHWVSDCPFANNDMKRTTGIPRWTSSTVIHHCRHCLHHPNHWCQHKYDHCRSFLKPAESNVPGAKINPQGLIVINEMEKQVTVIIRWTIDFFFGNQHF